MWISLWPKEKKKKIWSATSLLLCLPPFTERWRFHWMQKLRAQFDSSWSMIGQMTSICKRALSHHSLLYPSLPYEVAAIYAILMQQGVCQLCSWWEFAAGISCSSLSALNPSTTHQFWRQFNAQILFKPKKLIKLQVFERLKIRKDSSGLQRR